MPDINIFEQVKQFREKGISDGEIENRLSADGWSKTQIHDALDISQELSNIPEVKENPPEKFIVGHQLLLRSWKVFSSLWGPLLLLALISTVIIIGIQILFSIWPSTLVLYLLMLFVIYLAGAFFIIGITHSLVYSEKSTRKIFSNSCKLYLPFIWTSILAGLAMIGGFILFIFPGLILAVLFIPLPFVMVKEGKSGFSALKRCYAITRDFRLDIFWKVVMLVGIVAFITFILGLILVAFWLFVANVSTGELSFFLFVSGGLGFLLSQFLLLLIIPPYIQSYYSVLYADLSVAHPYKSDPESTLEVGRKIVIGFMMVGIFALMLFGLAGGKAIITGEYDNFLQPNKITREGIEFAKLQYQYFLIEKENLIYDESERNDVTRSIDIYGTQITLQEYFLDNEIYPATLEELVPSYLNSLLTDPETGEIYEYAPTEDRKGWSLCYNSDSAGHTCEVWP
ncbi:hypothetical protein ACFL0L_01410 [Patescibacteria group bacterium]